MSAEVEAQTRRELHRLERMPEGAAEAGMVRTYLEWVTELPWRLAWSCCPRATGWTWTTYRLGRIT